MCFGSQPEGWLEDEPENVEDPEATKPEDWDDEEDGAWEAPLVSNPKVRHVHTPRPWLVLWNVSMSSL